jgi:hypothetical protein
MRSNHHTSRIAGVLFAVTLGWTGSPWAQSRSSNSPPWKQLPVTGGYGSPKVGYVVTKEELATKPDTSSVCKDVRAIVKAAAKNFVQLRGERRSETKVGVLVWNSNKEVKEFTNCAVYQAESLGDYFMCMRTTECGKNKESFHAVSVALMSCLKSWSWQDGHVNENRGFYEDQQRMVTATNDDGLRITLELARAKVSWPEKCDLSLSIEVAKYDNY